MSFSSLTGWNTSSDTWAVLITLGKWLGFSRSPFSRLWNEWQQPRRTVMSSTQNGSMKCVCASKLCAWGQCFIHRVLLLSPCVVIFIPMLPLKDNDIWKATSRMESPWSEKCSDGHLTYSSPLAPTWRQLQWVWKSPACTRPREMIWGVLLPVRWLWLQISNSACN